MALGRSYTIPCPSAFRDRVTGLALRQGVSVADLVRAVQLLVPPATLAAVTDPGEPSGADREDCLDLVINASSLGMQGQPPLAFDWSHAPPGSIAYDIVTAPRDTVLLQTARAAGHRTIDGLSMLIGQAAVAFERFFGQPAPREHDAELRRILTA